MKKYSYSENNVTKAIPSDQENLPNIGILRNSNQNNYTSSNQMQRTIIESPSRNQGFNTLNSNNDNRSDLPIYVPPFLLNTNRPSSRRHDHNRPLDYLPWSVANIFICVIIALPALFFSVQTRDLNRAGNVKKAKVNSNRSLILNIIASVVGLLTILLAVILRFALYQLFVHNDVNSQNVPIIIAGGR